MNPSVQIAVLLLPLHMFYLILGFITAFSLTYLIVPVIIQVAKARKLYDKPNERSSHFEPTPSLGGIGIFAGAICGIVLWAPMQSFGILQYMLAAFVMIFLIGTIDDITPVSANKKLLGQLLVAVILVYKSKIGLHNFYGLFGVHELSELNAFIISTVAITGIINAFNLIDGIDGLAGSIGLLSTLAFGFWFARIDALPLAMVAFALAGGITAFLKYNFTPAQIFMGDTGSLLIGTVAAILAFKFIELNYQESTPDTYTFASAPAIAFSVLIMPIYDTMRVFAMRIFKGRSPFHPDKTHIHHLMLDAGLNHRQATVLLIGLNCLFIGGTLAFDTLGSAILLSIQMLMMTLLIAILYAIRHKTVKNT